ncbi:MAG: DUF2282 domain-containing protein [Spirochaetota bacterium]
MKKESVVIASTVAAVLALGVSTPIDAGKPRMEKCMGIVKKGKNDCGANGHSCAGMARKDNDPKEWIYLPKGTCSKIVGGKVKR